MEERKKFKLSFCNRIKSIISILFEWIINFFENYWLFIFVIIVLWFNLNSQIESYSELNDKYILSLQILQKEMSAKTNCSYKLDTIKSILQINDK